MQTNVMVMSVPRVDRSKHSERCCGSRKLIDGSLQYLWNDAWISRPCDVIKTGDIVTDEITSPAASAVECHVGLYDRDVDLIAIKQPHADRQTDPWTDRPTYEWTTQKAGSTTQLTGSKPGQCANAKP